VLIAHTISERACGDGLQVRVDGCLVASVICDHGLWTCINVGVGCRRVYPSRVEACAVARRIGRLLVAGEATTKRIAA